MNIQSLTSYNPDDMVFSDIKERKIYLPYSSNLNHQEIIITTKKEDGSTGPLILMTSLLSSHGVEESKCFSSDSVKPTLTFIFHKNVEKETQALDKLHKILDNCDSIIGDSTHTTDTTDTIDPQIKLPKNTKINRSMLYESKHSGNTYLRFKCTQSTSFFDQNDNILSLEQMMNRRCHCMAALQFDSLVSSRDRQFVLRVFVREVIVDTRVGRLMYPSIKYLHIADDSLDDDCEDIGQVAEAGHTDQSQLVTISHN